ncbi:MAG: hypothetical protein AABY01_03885, partial [Nanoarchaeota archaeon]
GMSDNGFYIGGDRTLKPLIALKFIKAERLPLLLSAAIDGSEVFKRRFRHCATRALMILRNYMGHQKRVGRQQVSSMILMSALKRINPNFSILKEAKREVLEDLMDIGNTTKVIKDIEEGRIKLAEIETKVPSPFAFNIALQGSLDVMKVEDKHEFLRRMHSMVLAKIAGVEIAQVSSREFIEKSREARDTFKEQLKKEAWNVKRVPRFAKQELIRIIEGERSNIDKRFLEGIAKYRSEIEANWPEELKKFLFTVLGDLRSSEFSYEQFWDEQKMGEQIEADDKQRKLVDQLIMAARRLKLDPLIRTDIFRLIEGEQNVRTETLVWLKEFAKKGIHKAWQDDIARFLVKKSKEL